MQKLNVTITLDKMDCFDGDSNAFFVIPDYVPEVLEELKKITAYLEGLNKNVERKK